MKPTRSAGPDLTHLAELRLLQTGSDSHDIRQQAVAVGQGYRLFTATPRQPPPSSGWPILYLLDGNAAFDALTVEMLAAVPGLMVAGVGYGTDRQFARVRRTLDLTPPDPTAPGADAEGLRPDHVTEGRMAGGAARFLQHLTGPLRQAAEAGASVDPGRRALWGHSLGGLCTIYALLTRPDSFARYAAISPSIWWDEPLMRRLAARATQQRPLLIALGDREQRTGSNGPPPVGPSPVTMAYVHDLARQPGIRADIYVLQGLQHIQTLAASLPLALRMAASD